MTCRRDGHDYGPGAGVLPELAEGQTQTCVVCGSSRSRSGGKITYFAPPELSRYPRGEVR